MLTNEDIEVPKKLIMLYLAILVSVDSRPSFSAQLSAKYLIVNLI